MPLVNKNPDDQLSREKRAVSYDSYDISVRQIIDMVEVGEINIAPEYQRHFVWDPKREAELIESILLGIPVPSLYMATNPDNSWEVVDGVQRISTLLHFCGSNNSLSMIGRNEPLKIKDLSKLDSFNGYKYLDLPKSVQFHFMTRPMRVTTLNDKSDNAVRYDLFERLNTGAVKLHAQEIRNCVFRGRFTDFTKSLSEDVDFRSVVRLPENELQAAGYEECVLRFFAFRDRYENFGHSVNEFLNEYAIDMNKSKGPFRRPNTFKDTMVFLREELPNGITRGNRINSTPINLYEAIAVGTALAIESGAGVRRNVLPNLLNDEDLRRLTTGGTNSRPMVTGRIQFVRDRLSA